METKSIIWKPSFCYKLNFFVMLDCADPTDVVSSSDFNLSAAIEGWFYIEKWHYE